MLPLPSQLPPCLFVFAGQQIREYLALKCGQSNAAAAAAAAAGGGGGDAAAAAEATADERLAASASWTLAELAAAVQQLAASKDLGAAEAELAGANLALLQGGGEGGEGGGGGSSSGVARRHVWYGDPLLSTSETRHSVEVRRCRGRRAGYWERGCWACSGSVGGPAGGAGRAMAAPAACTLCRLLHMTCHAPPPPADPRAARCSPRAAVTPHPPLVPFSFPSQPPTPSPIQQGYEAMEALLAEQQRQDWSMFEYAGQLVCRDVEGWQVTRGLGGPLGARSGAAA